jgi:hypothetical protein
MKYACVVKNNEGTWDIWREATYGTAQSHPNLVVKQDRLANAVNSGLPITGIVLTEHEHAGMPGAKWDGIKFSDGDKSSVKEDVDWSTRELYGYVCDDTIIYAFITEKGHPYQLQCEAIFDSETTIIEVPEGQTAKIGDVWDGENIISS